MTIHQAIDTILADIPGAPFAETVDTFKVGDTSRELSGIIVCFLATARVIEHAAKIGANLIITHEPLFYNHLDETDWLENDAVFRSKQALLAKHQLVVWRFHDYLHSIPPDSTVVGLMNELGWQPDTSADKLAFTNIPPTSLGELAKMVQARLGLRTIRLVGSLNLSCRRVAVLPGFPPARWQIGALNAGADVLIAGEIHEWETSEYVRDANALGHHKGVIVIGHAASEEPGMRMMTKWIAEKLPDVPIQFVPTINPFHYL
ncbi:MAG: Nif3-like dinuclear metal center hexameric protein [Anaerolineae bacterium]|nr:Nif3-like dinuclear metal center hexameric protein [Anaerolineae bacterium]